MKINMSVDSGYGYLMGKCAISKVSMPSYIEEVPSLDLKETISKIEKTNKENVLIKYNNKYYSVGRLATKINPKATRSLSNTRLNNEEYLVGVLAIMGLLYPNSTSFDSNLIVGLPEKLINDADKLEEWLSKEYEFSFVTKDGEDKKKINILNTICMNQGIAPIYLLPEEDLEKTIISTDIGHNTRHTVLWMGGQVPHNYRDDGDGMKTCYTDLEKLIRNKQEFTNSNKKPVSITSLSQVELERAIESGVLIRNKGTIDINNYLGEVYGAKAKEIFKSTENKYTDIITSVDMILINGGAMENKAFVEKLSESFSKLNNIEFVVFDDSQWSVVSGMYNYLSEVFEDDLGEVEDEVAVTEVKCNNDNVGEEVGE